MKKIAASRKIFKTKKAIQQMKHIMEELEREETLSCKAKHNIEMIQKIAAEMIG